MSNDSYFNRFVFYLFYSRQIRTGAQTREGTHPCRYAAKYPEPWPPAGDGHRIGWPASSVGRRAPSTHGHVRVYTREGDIDAPSRSRMPRLFDAHTGKCLDNDL